jgi:hypothetical protein
LREAKFDEKGYANECITLLAGQASGRRMTAAAYKRLAKCLDNPDNLGPELILNARFFPPAMRNPLTVRRIG